MDAETVDKADPTNSNVYVGNLSAEARPRARAQLQASQAPGRGRVSVRDTLEFGSHFCKRFSESLTVWPASLVLQQLPFVFPMELPRGLYTS